RGENRAGSDGADSAQALDDVQSLSDPAWPAGLLCAQAELPGLLLESAVPQSRSPNGAMMERLLERFCRYVRIDTQAVEGAKTYPSSPGQLELGRLLKQELDGLGLRDAEIDEHGIVTATI